MFDAYKVAVKLTLVNNVSSALMGISKDFAKTDAAAKGLQERINSIKNGLKLGLVTTGAGIALAGMFKPGIEEAMKFERAMLRIKDIGGMNSTILARVRADALSGKYQGIAADEAVDLFRDLHAAFGNAKDAMQFMPAFTTLARVTQGKYGKSAVAGEEDVRAIAKIAERRGGTKSPEAMGHAMDIVMKIQNASGGAVSPKDILAFVTQMGAMGNLMSDNGLLQYWALMQEQGGSKAGTALNSGLQNLVNGRGTEASGAVFRRLGLVNEQVNQAHLKQLYGGSWSKHLNKVTADAIYNPELAKSAPVEWMLKEGLPRINAYLDKAGVTDPRQRESETISLMAQGFSNRKGADSYAIIATQLARILKDYNIGLNSAGWKESAKSYDQSPMARFQKLDADYQTALINLGLAALPVLIPLVNRLAIAFKVFNEYAQRNPEKIKRVADGLLGLSAALIGFGTLTLVVNGMKALGLALTFAGVGGIGGASGITSIAAAIGSATTAGTLLFGLAGLGLIVGAMAIGLNKLNKNSDIDPINHPGQRYHHTGHGGYWAKDTTLSQDHAGMHRVSTRAGISWVKDELQTVRSRSANPTTINNKIVMPNGRVLAEVVTREQTKEASRPFSGQTTFDGSMNVTPPGMKVQH